MSQILNDCRRLLNSEGFPFGSVDVVGNRDELQSFLPVTKRTIGYIVGAVIFNEKNEVLLIQEAKSSCYGKWYLPMGRLEQNETLVEGAQREVKEEAGLEFEPSTIINFEHHRLWYRITFTGNITGGKLKTTADKDEESLQAGWFSVADVMNKEIKIRASDILPLISTAYQHRTKEITHPNVLPWTMTAHNKLLLRPMIVHSHKDIVRVLVNTTEISHIPVGQITERDQSLHVSLQRIFLNILGKGFSTDHGSLLTIEHSGRPAHHDGFCVNVLVSIKTSKLPQITKTDSYAWQQIENEDLQNQILHRLSEKNSLPVFS